MTTSIGHAIGFVGQRSDTSAFPAANERSAGPRDFEREFERAIVGTWFAAGPVGRIEPAPTTAPPGILGASAGDRLGASRGDAAGRSLREDDGRAAGEPPRPMARVAAAKDDPAVRGAPQVVDLPASASADASHATQVQPLQAAAISRSAVAEPAVQAGPDAGSQGTTGAGVPAPWMARPISPVVGGARALIPGTSGSTPFRTDPPDVAAPPPPPPIRLHLEADAGGAARVWLGVDAAARAASAAVLQQVRETLGRSGMRLSSIVVNGALLNGPVPPSNPRQDT